MFISVESDSILEERSVSVGRYGYMRRGLKELVRGMFTNQKKE
jgi:hypothetical protein